MKKAILGTLVAGSLALGGALAVAQNCIDKDAKFTKQIYAHRFALERRTGDVRKNTYLYDKDAKVTNIKVRSGLEFISNGRLVLNGKTYYNVVAFDGAINSPTGLLRAGDASIRNLDTPINFSLDEASNRPVLSGVEEFCDRAIGTVYSGFEDEHEKLQKSREFHYLYLIYETNRQDEPSSRKFIGDMLESETDAANFESLLETLTRYEDKRFAKIVEKRFDVGDLTNDRIETARYKMSRYLALAAPLHAAQKLIGILSDQNLPENYRGVYTSSLSTAGGQIAINYLVKHFDENGVKYAEFLTRAVKNRSQATFVNEFLNQRFQNWQGSCQDLRYEIPGFRKFQEQYGFERKATACTN